MTTQIINSHAILLGAYLIIFAVLLTPFVAHATVVSQGRNSENTSKQSHDVCTVFPESLDGWKLSSKGEEKYVSGFPVRVAIYENNTSAEKKFDARRLPNNSAMRMMRSKLEEMKQGVRYGNAQRSQIAGHLVLIRQSRKNPDVFSIFVFLDNCMIRIGQAKGSESLSGNDFKSFAGSLFVQ